MTSLPTAILHNKSEEFKIDLMTESPTDPISKPHQEIFAGTAGGIV